jgi:hypothetical protein
MFPSFKLLPLWSKCLTRVETMSANFSLFKSLHFCWILWECPTRFETIVLICHEFIAFLLNTYECLTIVETTRICWPIFTFTWVLNFQAEIVRIEEGTMEDVRIQLNLRVQLPRLCSVLVEPSLCLPPQCGVFLLSENWSLFYFVFHFPQVLMHDYYTTSWALTSNTYKNSNSSAWYTDWAQYNRVYHFKSIFTYINPPYLFKIPGLFQTNTAILLNSIGFSPGFECGLIWTHIKTTVRQFFVKFSPITCNIEIFDSTQHTRPTLPNPRI